MKRLLALCFALLLLAACGAEEAPTSPTVATTTEAVTTAATATTEAATQTADTSIPAWMDRYPLDFWAYQGIDLLPVMEEYSPEALGDFGVDDVYIQLDRGNFTYPDINYWDDYLVNITVNYMDYTLSIFCIFRADTMDSWKTYTLVDTVIIYNCASYRAVDLNGDFIQELYFTDLYTRQWRGESAYLYFLKDDILHRAFEAVLEETYYYRCSTVHNSLRFVESPGEWYDIEVEYVIMHWENGIAAEDESNVIWAQQTVHYRFNGIEYVAADDAPQLDFCPHTELEWQMP